MEHRNPLLPEEAAQKFIDALGTKVQLKGDFSRGTITISYFTKDDLNRIYERIIEKK